MYLVVQNLRRWPSCAGSQINSQINSDYHFWKVDGEAYYCEIMQVVRVRIEVSLELL